MRATNHRCEHGSKATLSIRDPKRLLQQLTLQLEWCRQRAPKGSFPP